MSRAIRFEDEAEQEYRAAARWYDDQRAGLSTEFLDTVDAGATDSYGGGEGDGVRGVAYRAISRSG